MYTGHNISPCLDKQLVLELDFRVLLLEFRQRLPCSIICRKVVPLNKDMPVTTAVLSAQHMLRSRKQTPILHQRKNCSSRRSPSVRFQLADMEDIMKASTS